MGKLFGSLYIYIILSLLILTGTVEKLWPHKEGEQAILLQAEFSQSIALLLNTPDGLAKVTAHYPTEIFDSVDVLFLQEQHEQLANQQGVISFNQQQQAYWSFLLDDKIVRVGPIDVIAPTFDTSWPYILMLILISVPIGLWSVLLLRDFNQLKQACKAMNAPEQANFDTGYSSVLLPITDLIQTLQQRIKQLLNSQKDLTSAVSHEFRTPLARLKFAIAMIEESDLHEGHSPYLNGMKRDITELEALVTEMLKFAQMDRETPKLNYSRVDLVQLTQHLVKKLQQGDDMPQCHFIGESQLVCECDAHFMERALQNLLGNALKYAKQRIEISFSETQTEIHISISDDGDGIVQQDWEHVFKPFVRLDKSRDKEKGGFGLGLAIVEKIVLWHRGTINLQQNHLTGASFVIAIPKNKT